VSSTRLTQLIKDEGPVARGYRGSPIVQLERLPSLLPGVLKCYIPCALVVVVWKVASRKSVKRFELRAEGHVAVAIQPRSCVDTRTTYIASRTIAPQLVTSVTASTLQLSRILVESVDSS
jgi:hypothetical protein